MTARMSHVVVYDPVASLRILTLTEAAMYLDISPELLRGKVKNDELYAKAFWKEGSHYRTSVRNLQELHAELGNRNLMEAKAA